VTLGRGVSLGLLTGCIGTFVIALFSIPLQLLMSPGSGLIDQVRQSMNQIPNMPPETRQAFEALSAHAGIIYAFGFIFMLGFCCLFGMAGGAIGVALFEKRKPGSGDTPSYQPPENILPPPPPPE
jgi:MFS superfamily sulfate permease-like transporter